MQVSEIPLIVITGTNGSGKSALGIELAQKYNGEIISADSRQIYKGFDLCCGKVTEEERRLVPHYMLDECSVGEIYSVSEYQEKVYRLMVEIFERGKLPFLVGGTGLYVDAVVKGYDFKEEESDRNFREQLEQKSVEELQAMLSDEARQRLRENNSDFNNKRRLERFIEKERNGCALDHDNKPLKKVLEFGVTWPKPQLHERIEQRLRQRIEDGMLEEVREYLNGGGDPKHLYSLGLDYKYITRYHEGCYKNQEAFVQELSQADKRYAKQQMKWFRRNPDIHWLDMTKDPAAEASAFIDAFLKSES